MCPSVIFCTLKHNASGNQEVHDNKGESLYKNIASASLSSSMAKIPSNSSFLEMITTPSYLTGTRSSFGVYVSSNFYGTTIPTIGSSSKFNLFLPPSSQLLIDELLHGPCCRQCSCSPNCSLANNCCIDAPLDYNYIPLPKLCGSAYNEVSRQRSNVNWPELDYLITEHSGDNCLNDFLYPRNSTFDDLVFVSTKEVIYKNKRHAACEGETNVKR